MRLVCSEAYGTSELFLQFARCAYVIVIMAVYWCTDVIPVAVTSLLPVLLFPLLKVLDSKQVSKLSRGLVTSGSSHVLPYSSESL
jgi:di/tricarboxylate transporter